MFRRTPLGLSLSLCLTGNFKLLSVWCVYVCVFVLAAEFLNKMSKVTKKYKTRSETMNQKQLWPQTNATILSALSSSLS